MKKSSQKPITPRDNRILKGRFERGYFMSFNKEVNSQLLARFSRERERERDLRLAGKLLSWLKIIDEISLPPVVLYNWTRRTGIL